MNSKNGLLIALAMFGASLHAGAQTADDVVKKHIAAIGGPAWKKVSSIKFVADMDMMGQKLNATQVVMPGKGMRQDLSFNGQKGYTIVTPTAGWTYMPIAPGQDSVMPMPEDVLAANQAELSVGSILYSAKENNTAISLLGKEELDGKQSFKMLLVSKDGDSSTVWVDAQSYYILRRDEVKEMGGQTIPVESTYTEYKKLPEGVVVPVIMKQKAMGMDFSTATFSGYEINKQKDMTIFKP